MNKDRYIKINYSEDMYKWYLDKKLKEDPQLYTLPDRVIKEKGIYVLAKKNKQGQEEIVMTFTIFKMVLKKCNFLIVEVVSEGHTFHFGPALGHLQASRISRNFKKKVPNFLETDRLRKETGDPNIVVYHTSDTYCRISWKKKYYIKNIAFYKLMTAAGKNGVKARFSRKLKADPMLEYRYVYYKN